MTSNQKLNYVNRNKKKDVVDHIVKAKENKISCCLAQKTIQKKPVKPVGEKFDYLFTFLKKKFQINSLLGKHRKSKLLMTVPSLWFSTQGIKQYTGNWYPYQLFSSSHQKEKRHQTCTNWEDRTGSKWVHQKGNGSKKKIFWEPNWKVWKVELIDETRDFECYTLSDGKHLRVDVDQEITKSDVKIILTHCYWTNRGKKKLTIGAILESGVLDWMKKLVYGGWVG